MMNAVATSASTSSLSESKFVLLTTYRKNGSPVATPVCHVVHDDLIHIVTLESTWKAKRMRRNPQVLLASCDMRGNKAGTVFSGAARILTQEEIRLSPVFKELRSVGVAFKRSAGAHWIVKPIQLFERAWYHHKFLAIVIEPNLNLEAAQ